LENGSGNKTLLAGGFGEFVRSQTDALTTWAEKRRYCASA